MLCGSSSLVRLLPVGGRFCLVTVYALNDEAKLIRREVKDGMYSPTAYFIVHTAIQVPSILLLSLCAGVPAAYPIIRFPWAGLLRFWLVYFAMLLATEGTAQAFSLHEDPLVGLLNFMQVWFMAFLFNGISVPVNSVVWPFRALTYCTPYRYGFAALIYVTFIDTPTYSGALRCHEPLQLDPAPPWGPYCIVSSLDADGFGYVCPALPPAACYGRTGRQILSSIGATFKSVTADDIWLQYSAYVSVQVIFWKVAFLVVFAWISRSYQALRVPGGGKGITPLLIEHAGLQPAP